MPDLDPIAFGKDMGDLVRSAVQPLKDQIANLEKQLAEVKSVPGPSGEKGDKGEDGAPGKDGADGLGIASASINDKGELELEFTDGTAKTVGRVVGKDGEKGADGADGRDGVNGKDADPIEVGQDEILAALKSDPVFMREVVAEYLKENPPPAGKDGRDGVNGKDGRDGIDGKDGAGATGAMIDKNGELIITLSDGTLQRCGVVVGKDGAPGKDGADLSDVDFEYDGERGVTVKAKGGQIVKSYQMPVIIDKGYWREGCTAEAGDAYTHDGSLWIAKRKTSSRPSSQAKEDWRLAARKGRDGKAGKDARLSDEKPVNLRRSDD